MKTFDEIYEELKSADNNELHNAWQEAKKKSEKANKISAIICLIIDLFAIIMIFGNGMSFKSPVFLMPLIPVLIINFIVVVIVNVLFSGKEQIKYNEKYKEVVINKLISNFYDNLEYFPQKEMPEYIYGEPRYEYYDEYKSEDYIEAQINNKYSIQMAEVLTKEEEQYKDSDGKTQTREITKFHGLFAKIIMDKSIDSELRITPNGGILKKDRLNMDSSEFEKLFDVQASNQIIGMQLLTADVMEELIAFKNNANMRFDIFIKGNELYFRFHSGDMFEAGSLKKDMLHKETIQKYFNLLNFTYNLSDKLINLVNETQI